MSKDATPQTVPCLVLPQPYAAEVLVGRREVIAWPKKLKLRPGRCLIRSAGPRPGPGEDPKKPRDGGRLQDQPEAILGELEVVQVVPGAECQLLGAGNKWAILFRYVRVYRDPVPQREGVPWRVRNVAPSEVAEAADAAESPARWQSWHTSILDGMAADAAARRGEPMD